MNKQWIRKGSLALAATLMLSLLVPTGSMADDSIVEIKRDTIGSRVLEYSPAVKNLELGLISVSRSYMSYKDSMEDFEDIYDSLGTYESLNTLYNSLSSDYSIYMGLMLSGDPTSEVIAGYMIDGDVTDPDAVTHVIAIVITKISVSLMPPILKPFLMK